MIDNRTTHLDLPLPDPSNALNEDVLRIIAALQSIDTAVAGRVTTADVSAAVAALVDSSPATLDTLKELASALGNDANFAATLMAALALKAPLVNPAFTGTVSGVTAAMVGLGNVDNTSVATERAAVATLTNKTLTSPVINSPTGTGFVTSINGATGAVTGVVDLTTVQELANKKLRAVWVVGKSTSNASATGTVSLDMSGGTDFSLTLTGNTYVQLANVPLLTGETLAFVVKVTQGGTAYTLTWFGSVTWLTVGGTAPAAPAAGKTIEYIFTTDGSGVYFGRKGAAT